MIDWDKYVGIPWKFLGDTREEGCDCIGLIRLVYRENGWGDVFRDGKPIEPNWYEKNPYRLINYLCRNFDKVDKIVNLEEGDIVYFKINGEGHVALWMGYGRMLQAFPPIDENIIKLSHVQRIRYIEEAFICGFRRRDENGRTNSETEGGTET